MRMCLFVFVWVCTRVHSIFVCVMCILMINSFGFPGIFRHIYNYFSPLFAFQFLCLICLYVCLCDPLYIWYIHSIVPYLLFTFYLLFFSSNIVVIATEGKRKRIIEQREKSNAKNLQPKMKMKKKFIKKSNKWLTNVRLRNQKFFFNFILTHLTTIVTVIEVLHRCLLKSFF